MNCPIDNTQLTMTERQGIEIDYCPACRGVWLDRGELDKIIDRSFGQSVAPQTAPSQTQPSHKAPTEHVQTPHHYQKKRKKESFFEDLFDF